MLPVKLAAVPATFESKVTIPGLRAIAELIGRNTHGKRYARTAGRPFLKAADLASEIASEKFPAYWREAISDLMEAYGEICSYSCFRIHTVTGAASADHFIAKSKNWRKVYLWSNYRLCCSKVNSRKNDFADVIDPFAVVPDSFQLELLGFQVLPNSLLGPVEKAKVEDTIKRLGLNDFCEERAEDAEDYWAGDCSLQTLRKESPFVAYELFRQGRLNQGDVW